jgi:hypothetical protein
MNRWLQTKKYQCPRCEERYVHDKGYEHEVFLCPHRGGGRNGNAAIPRKTGVPALAGQET